jgi:hypothetical protein
MSMMRRMLWDGIKLSADLGDGGGGGDAGGLDPAAAAAPEGGIEGGEGDPGQAQPFDYESLAKQFGGPEGLKQAAMSARDIHLRSQYNPQFKETLQRALRGEYGPEAQQKAEQQQGQGQQQQQAPKADRAALQMFHRELQRAKESGDPEALKAVYDDPANAKAKEAYLAHLEQQNNDWYDPDSAWERRLNAPQTQQWLQQQLQQQMQPMQEQFNHDMKQMWYSNPANKQALDTLPENIQQAFMNGFYGAGPNSPYREWVQAVGKAVEHAKQQAQQGVPQPTPNANTARDVTTPPQSQNGRQPARNGSTERPQPSLRDAAKKAAADLVKAKAKDNS